VPFSADLMSRIKQEATALGLRSASSISVALREQLVGEKTGDMDGRSRVYWAAARVVNKGWATPLPGAARLDGLDALSALASSASMYVQRLQSPNADPLQANCAKDSVPAARVALTRNGHAHVVVVLPTSRQAPETPDSWVDLYVYKTEADAAGKAASLTAGKVF